jgi:hypothetical protein
MITVLIKNSINNNGLGNTLFMLAAGEAMALRDGKQMVSTEPPGYETYRNNILRNIKLTYSVQYDTYREPSFEYNEIPYSDNSISLDGFFQSEKYFNDYSEFILDLFSPTPEIERYIDRAYGDIFDNSVSIHVRRGDYLNYPDIHPVCEMDYYKSALANFSDCKRFIVFSDDIAWCKDNFSEDFHFIEGERDFIDLYMMAKCTNNIIANSTFSWWGAWLNRNENKKVIAPKIWFGKDKKLNTKDLIPKEWRLI